MNKCENLSNGTCVAFRVISKGFKTETHVPKFCATSITVGGNEFDPQVRFTARCVAAENIEDQQQCDDFVPSTGGWKSPSAQY